MTFQADVETDEVYAQMTLQPLTAVKYLYDSVSRSVILATFINIPSLNLFHSYSKSKRIHFYPWNWGFRVDSQQITFARRWQRVIQAPMEVSLYLVVLLRKFFLHWYIHIFYYMILLDLMDDFWHFSLLWSCRIFHNSHQHKSWLQGTFMMSNGSLGIFFEVSPVKFCPLAEISAKVFFVNGECLLFGNKFGSFFLLMVF